MTINLGKALTILAEQEAAERFMHADVAAWHAPSECHADVSRGEAERFREARRHAEATAGAPLRIIAREAKRRGGICICSYDPSWQGFVARVYAAKDYPF